MYKLNIKAPVKKINKIIIPGAVLLLDDILLSKKMLNPTIAATPIP
jgi:hypothetical protein